MKQGGNWNRWRPLAGVLAVGVLAYSLALEGSPAPKRSGRTVERQSTSLQKRAPAPKNLLLTNQSAAGPKILQRTGSPQVGQVGQVVTYGWLPKGELRVMPPVVVDYRDDLPSRLRREGKLIGPVPLGSVVTAGGIAAGAPCGGGCTFPIECDDNNPCTVDTCDYVSGQPPGTGSCDNAVVANGLPGACGDGEFCNGIELCQGGSCIDGDDPDCTGLVCDEFQDACVDACTSDQGCSDGKHCTGIETCVNDVCQPGTNPCGAGAACAEKICTNARRPCARDDICEGVGLCNLDGPACYEGRCCINTTQQPTDNQVCSNDFRRTDTQGPNQTAPDGCEEAGGLFYPTDEGRVVPAFGNSCLSESQVCPQISGGIAPQGPFVQVIGPISDSCALRVPAGDPTQPLNAVIDDYDFSAIDGGHEFYELHAMRWVGGAARIFIEFFDENGNFIDDTLPLVIFDSDIVIRPIIFTPPLPIPSKGFIRFRNASQFTPGGQLFLATTDSFDVGTNDPNVLCLNEEVLTALNGVISSCTDPGASSAAASTGRLAFEMVAKVADPPSGACCDRLLGTCLEDVKSWVCASGKCSNDDSTCSRSEECGTGNTCVTGVYLGDGALCGVCGDDSPGEAPGSACVDIGPNNATCLDGTCIAKCSTGACCIDATGDCLPDRLKSACSSLAPSEFLGFGTDCDPNCCDQPVMTGSDDCNTATLHNIAVPTAAVCVGGSNDGNTCPNGISDCPDGVDCNFRKVVTITGNNAGASSSDGRLCVGGINDGNECFAVNVDADCAFCEGGVKNEESCDPAAGNDDCLDPNTTNADDGVCVGECVDQADTCFGFNPTVGADPGWWEAFTINDCAYVRIDHCCTDPIHEPGYIVIYDTCNPCGPAIFASPNPTAFDETQDRAARGAPYCTADNLWSWFGPLAAGTYYFPVFSGVAGHLGPYQLHITVDACPLAACCETGSDTCVGGEFSEGRNILDCEADGGFYLGPPNRELVAPQSCLGTICETGSCCAPEQGNITGPGSCSDRVTINPMTLSSCDNIFGDFIGGIRCKGGHCANVPNVTCDGSVGDCPGSTCVGEVLELAQPTPCPICEIEGSNNCQKRTTLFVQFDISELTLGGLTVADDFVPNGNVLTTVCTSGLYISTFDEGRTGCRQRIEAEMPDPLDKFRITIYEDDDGLPGAIFKDIKGRDAVRFASKGGSLWGVANEGFSARLEKPFGPNSVGFGSDEVTDEDYQIDISADPIEDLVTDPPTTYWIEIINNMDQHEECIWLINHANTGEGNEYSAPGAGGFFAGAAPFDITFCLNFDFTAPDAPLGGCCTCGDGLCVEDKTLAECNRAEGNWFAGDNNCGGDCIPGAPPNNTCENMLMIGPGLDINGDPTSGSAVTWRTNHFCATTSLPDIPVCTDFSGGCDTKCGGATGDIVGQDLWYGYVAPADGTGFISMCQTGTVWDSMFAIYQGEIGTGVCPCPTDIATCNTFGYTDGNTLEISSDEGCFNEAVGGPGILEREFKENTCYVLQVGAWGPTASTPGLGFISLGHQLGSALLPLEEAKDLVRLCDHDSGVSCLEDVDCRPGGICVGSNPPNTDKCGPVDAVCLATDYNRVGDFKMPTSAVAGGQEVAIRVTLKTMYAEGTNDCPVRVGGLPDLSVFGDPGGLVRYLGVPDDFANNSLDDPRWVGAKLQCAPFYRDWSPAKLAAEFGAGVDTSTIYYYGAEVAPCSIYHVQQGTQSCVDSANEDCFSDPLEVLTALWGDVTGDGLVNFTDIGAEVNAFKSIPLASGGLGNWRSMLRENQGAAGAKVNFTDIGKTVDGFKKISYKETGPDEFCDDGIDNDCDGDIDCADSDCGDGSDCGEGCPGAPEEDCECSEGACVDKP